MLAVCRFLCSLEVLPIRVHSSAYSDFRIQRVELMDIYRNGHPFPFDFLLKRTFAKNVLLLKKFKEIGLWTSVVTGGGLYFGKKLPDLTAVVTGDTNLFERFSNCILSTNRHLSPMHGCSLISGRNTMYRRKRSVVEMMQLERFLNKFSIYGNSRCFKVPKFQNMHVTDTYFRLTQSQGNKLF